MPIKSQCETIAGFQRKTKTIREKVDEFIHLIISYLGTRPKNKDTREKDIELPEFEVTQHLQ